MLIDTRNSPFAKVHALDAKDIHWTEGFWKEREAVTLNSMSPHIREKFEDKRPLFHMVENFRIAAGLSEGEHHGTVFDGDFYKWLESAMFAGTDIDAYIDLIGKAQKDDGYISTKQIIAERRGETGVRGRDINEFEVYNFGHLFTAACIHKRLTGKDNFLRIAEKAAANLKQMYEHAAKTGDVKTAVCPSHYMGLIELYRTTGNKDYLETAQLCINLRDKVKNGSDDNQDRIPLREQRKIVGHGVRATYLYAGLADLYLETGDETLLPVLDSCYDNLVNQKLYITGGCGALYQGVSPLDDFVHGGKMHQCFGYEYQLPNITAYNETCAGLGNIFWSYRLFAIRPEARYFDIIERTMYNLALAAVSLDGKKYFYENMLRRTKSLDYRLTWPLTRDDELNCYCCPSNLVRVLAEAQEYCYMLSGDAVYTGLYGSNEAVVTLDKGARFTLVQETGYPFEGDFIFRFKEVKQNQPFTLNIRVPGWVESGSIQCNGALLANIGTAEAGKYYALPIADAANCVVQVHFDMPSRLTVAHSKVEEDTNQACVERGPLVYCIESNGAPGESSLEGLLLPVDAAFTEKPHRIAGVEMTTLETQAVALEKKGYDENALYQTLKPGGVRQVPITLIPYFAWDNCPENGPNGEMKIWLPLYYSL
jgi:DUF1680 family protein